MAPAICNRPLHLGGEGRFGAVLLYFCTTGAHTTMWKAGKQYQRLVPPPAEAPV